MRLFYMLFILQEKQLWHKPNPMELYDKTYMRKVIERKGWKTLLIEEQKHSLQVFL